MGALITGNQLDLEKTRIDFSVENYDPEILRDFIRKANDLIERLKADEAFAKVNLKTILNPKSYIGRAPQQVDEFLMNIVTPIRRKYRSQLNRKVKLKV